jgi:alpha-tubulin N-acetyltransferase 1
MLNAENQTAYLLVDKFGNSGMGSVVLKVGRKKLFLIDEAGKSNEMVPQRVLDFYVVERRQRSGCGKRLFESMLRGEQVEPRYVECSKDCQ